MRIHQFCEVTPMSIQLNLEIQEVQTILGGLAKLPLEVSLDTWAKVKNQAEQQLTNQAPGAPGQGHQPEPEPEPTDIPQANA